MTATTRRAHCWADGPSFLEWMEVNPDADVEAYMGSTCMLAKGHDGPHEFTPDDRIGITFASAEEP